MKKPLNLTGHIINQMTATTTRHEQLTGKVVPNEPEISNKKIQNSSLSGSCATGFPNGLFFDKPLPNPGITNDTQTRFEQLSGKSMPGLIPDLSDMKPGEKRELTQLPGGNKIMVVRREQPPKEYKPDPDQFLAISSEMIRQRHEAKRAAGHKPVSELNFKRVSELKHEDLMDTKDKPVVDANPWEGWGRDNYPSVLSMPDPRFRHDRAPYPSALQALQAGNKAIDITCLNGDDVTSESYQRLTAGMTLSEDFKYIINRALGLAHPNAEAAKECMGALNALKQWDTEYGAQAFFADRRFKQRANELAQAMVYTGIGAAFARFHFQAKPANVDPYEKIGFFKLAGAGVFERAPDLTWLVLAAERCVRPKEVFNRLVDAWLFEVTAEIKKGVPGAAVKRTDVIGELAAQGLCQDVYMKHIASSTVGVAPGLKTHIDNAIEASSLILTKTRKPSEIDQSRFMVAQRPLKMYLDPPESPAQFSAQIDDLCNKVASWTNITRDFDIDMEPMEMPNAMMYKSAPYVPPHDIPPIHEDRTGEAVAKFGNWYDEARKATVELKPLAPHRIGRELNVEGPVRIVEFIRSEEGEIVGKIETALDSSFSPDDFQVKVNGQPAEIEAVRLSSGDVLSISFVPPKTE